MPENNLKKAPYGSWESIITPEWICRGANLPWETKIDGDTFYWTEQRPLEGGRSVIIKWSPTTGPVVLMPSGYSAKTKVYVYGGSTFCVKGDLLYFVNDKDQCIYSQKTSSDIHTPIRITSPTLNLKFAELIFAGNGLIALIETADEKHKIAFIDTATGSTKPLLEGADFYSSPQLSPDGHTVAWLEWNHPNMSWDEASLWIGSFDGSSINDKVKVAGEPNVSISQPVWNSNGNLGFLSDQTGWWNLYEWNQTLSSVTSLCPMKAECGVPQWRFNTTWGYSGNTAICAYKVKEGWALGHLVNGKLIEIKLPFNSYSQIKVDDSHILLMAGSSTKTFAIYRLDLKDNKLLQLSESADSIPQEWISMAKPVTFPTGPNGTKIAYGYFYPPTNPHYTADGPPPVIVKIHGGPTGAAEVSLRPVIQFWTSRGFAIFDVDYTGSTGYGREFRDALNGQWGIADRDDILNGVHYLVKQHWVDPERLYISGSSAGGFTLLRSLIAENIFTKAVCYYGVCDLEALAKDTHKFEKHYLDQLIAPYPEQKAIYIERSPVTHLDQIHASVLIFQGLEDKVVPPDQSRTLFETLRKNGIPTELVEYEGEGHGFRQSTTLINTLEMELNFLKL